MVTARRRFISLGAISLKTDGTTIKTELPWHRAEVSALDYISLEDADMSAVSLDFVYCPKECLELFLPHDCPLCRWKEGWEVIYCKTLEEAGSYWVRYVLETRYEKHGSTTTSWLESEKR